MSDVEQKNLINEAVLKTMLEIDPIAKNRKNEQQGFKYRGIDDLYQALQHIMANNGLFTTSRIVETNYTSHTKASGGITFMAKATVEYTLHHVSGQTITSQVLTSGMGSDDKDAFKAMSGAHKYFLLQLFMIPTEEPKDPEYETIETGSAESLQVSKPNKVDQDKRELLSLKELTDLFSPFKEIEGHKDAPFILSELKQKIIKCSGDKKALIALLDEYMAKFVTWKANAQN